MDDGLYDDLLEDEEAKKTAERDRRAAAAAKLAEERRRELEGMREHNRRLEEAVATARANLDSLLKTARAEVRRKDERIAELKREVDGLAFRRTARTGAAEEFGRLHAAVHGKEDGGGTAERLLTEYHRGRKRKREQDGPDEAPASKVSKPAPATDSAVEAPAARVEGRRERAPKEAQDKERPLRRSVRAEGRAARPSRGGPPPDERPSGTRGTTERDGRVRKPSPREERRRRDDRDQQRPSRSSRDQLDRRRRSRSDRRDDGRVSHESEEGRDGRRGSSRHAPAATGERRGDRDRQRRDPASSSSRRDPPDRVRHSGRDRRSPPTDRRSSRRPPPTGKWRKEGSVPSSAGKTRPLELEEGEIDDGDGEAAGDQAEEERLREEEKRQVDDLELRLKGRLKELAAIKVGYRRQAERLRVQELEREGRRRGRGEEGEKGGPRVGLSGPSYDELLGNRRAASGKPSPGETKKEEGPKAVELPQGRERSDAREGRVRVFKSFLAGSDPTPKAAAQGEPEKGLEKGAAATATRLGEKGSKKPAPGRPKDTQSPESVGQIPGGGANGRSRGNSNGDRASRPKVQQKQDQNESKKDLVENSRGTAAAKGQEGKSSETPKLSQDINSPESIAQMLGGGASGPTRRLSNIQSPLEVQAKPTHNESTKGSEEGVKETAVQVFKSFLGAGDSTPKEAAQSEQKKGFEKGAATAKGLGEKSSKMPAPAQSKGTQSPESFVQLTGGSANEWSRSKSNGDKVSHPKVWQKQNQNDSKKDLGESTQEAAASKDPKGKKSETPPPKPSQDINSPESIARMLGGAAGRKRRLSNIQSPLEVQAKPTQNESTKGSEEGVKETTAAKDQEERSLETPPTKPSKDINSPEHFAQMQEGAAERTRRQSNIQSPNQAKQSSPKVQAKPNPKGSNKQSEEAVKEATTTKKQEERSSETLAPGLTEDINSPEGIAQLLGGGTGGRTRRQSSTQSPNQAKLAPSESQADSQEGAQEKDQGGRRLEASVPKSSEDINSPESIARLLGGGAASRSGRWSSTQSPNQSKLAPSEPQADSQEGAQEKEQEGRSSEASAPKSSEDINSPESIARMLGGGAAGRSGRRSNTPSPFKARAEPAGKRPSPLPILTQRFRTESASSSSRRAAGSAGEDSDQAEKRERRKRKAAKRRRRKERKSRKNWPEEMRLHFEKWSQGEGAAQKEFHFVGQ